MELKVLELLFKYRCYEMSIMSILHNLGPHSRLTTQNLGWETWLMHLQRPSLEFSLIANKIEREIANSFYR